MSDTDMQSEMFGNNSVKQIDHKHYKMGQAPYRFVGVWSAPSQAMMEANPSAFNLAMKEKPPCCHMSCDHCGTGIIHHCIIKDSNGQQFAVGTDCIQKLNDTELVTQAIKAKKERDADRRKVLAEEKRQERELRIKMMHDQEREVNGGLTNYELRLKLLEDADSEFVSKSIDACQWIIQKMKLAKETPFVFSVTDDMERSGKLPYGGGKSTVIEIISKLKGRKGSKAYEAEKSIVTDEYRSVVTAIAALKESRHSQVQDINQRLL